MHSLTLPKKETSIVFRGNYCNDIKAKLEQVLDFDITM